MKIPAARPSEMATRNLMLFLPGRALASPHAVHHLANGAEMVGQMGDRADGSPLFGELLRRERLDHPHQLPAGSLEILLQLLPLLCVHRLRLEALNPVAPAVIAQDPLARHAQVEVHVPHVRGDAGMSLEAPRSFLRGETLERASNPGAVVEVLGSLAGQPSLERFAKEIDDLSEKGVLEAGGAHFGSFCTRRSRTSAARMSKEAPRASSGSWAASSSSSWA